MATDTTLNAEKRDGTGKGVARKLRQEGKIPGVLYGRELDSMHLSLDSHAAELLFRSISVDNTIVQLKVKGVKEPFETLVREIQTHPFKDTLLHVDFLRIQKGVMVDLNIPVHLVGVPVGVKQDGGVLEQIVHDLAVRCIPSQIPESFEVDVSALELNDSLHVSDLDLGEGVEVMIDLGQTICAVSVPRVVEEAVEEELEEGEALEAGEEAPEEGAGGSGGEEG